MKKKQLCARKSVKVPEKNFEVEIIRLGYA